MHDNDSSCSNRLLPLPACMHTKRCLANKNACGPAGGKLLSSSKQNSAHDCTMRSFPTWNACSLMWGQQTHLLVSHITLTWHPCSYPFKSAAWIQLFFSSLFLSVVAKVISANSNRGIRPIFLRNKVPQFSKRTAVRGMPWQNFSLSCRTLFEHIRTVFSFGFNPAPLCLHNVCRPVWLLWSLLV